MRGLAAILIQRVGMILELRAQILKRLGPAAVPENPRRPHPVPVPSTT